MAVGTTGESATLDEDEHCEVIRRTVEFAAGRVPVIAGTGANATTEAIRLTRCAQCAGADACLLVTPYYNKPTQEGLYLHHRAVAEAVDIPQILYNVPGRTACDMLPETVARLAPVPNIVGVKEATGDLDRVARLRALCGDDFALYSGDDATAREFMLRGGDGVISVTANVAPAAMHRMCAAALAGDAAAGRLRSTMQPRRPARGACSWNPTRFRSNGRWREMGSFRTGIRLPLTWLSSRRRAGGDCDAMRRAGISAQITPGWRH